MCAPTKDADRFGQLVAECVREGGVPLVQQVDPGDDHQGGEARVGDCLDADEGFAAAGREDDAAAAVGVGPGGQGGVLVRPGFDGDVGSEF